MAITESAVSVYFRVIIDGQDLGAFTSCEGLSFEIDVETREEGGNNGFVHQLPGRIRYQNITLTRPVNGDSQKLANWFRSMHGRIKRTSAEISALTYNGKDVVASWSLEGVIPIRWSGPTLSADDVRVATETFELAHHGFLGRA